VLGGRGPLGFPDFNDPYTGGFGAVVGPWQAVAVPDVRAAAVLVRGTVAPAAGAASAPGWELGYELARQHTHYAGLARRHYTGHTAAAPDTVTIAGRVHVGALWASRRWTLGPTLTVEPGLRVELAGGDGAAALRPSPRLTARWNADTRTLVSLAGGRAVQYVQALPRLATWDITDARAYPGALWLTAGAGRAAGDDRPGHPRRGALGERRLARERQRVRRRTRGLATSDPTPGDPAARALWVGAGERGHGVELSARRLVGRTTATVAYAWSASALDAAGRRYRSPQDRTHTVDATLSRRLGARWRVAGAFAAATGSPYTRASRASSRTTSRTSPSPVR
jgi:hypothetical protein